MGLPKIDHVWPFSVAQQGVRLMPKFSAVVVAGLALVAAAPASAQFGPPPAERYSLTVILETLNGDVLSKSTTECDPLRWCEGVNKRLVVSGSERAFVVKTRYMASKLQYDYFFSEVAAPQHRKGSIMLEMPFRKNEREAVDLYNSPTGSAYDAMKPAKFARMRIEIKY
jgi:hypothetical protein